MTYCVTTYPHWSQWRGDMRWQRWGSWSDIDFDPQKRKCCIPVAALWRRFMYIYIYKLLYIVWKTCADITENITKYILDAIYIRDTLAMVVRDLLQRLSVETLVVVPLQMGQTARNMEGDGVKKKWSQWSGLKYSYDFQYRIKCSTIFLSCRGNHRNICSEPCPKTAVPAWLSYLISLVPVLSCVCNARSFWPAHPPRYDSYVRWCQKQNPVTLW